MNVVHTIRLRGAWEIATQPDGRVSCMRSFGKPRTLDLNETLWLVADGIADVSVNNQPLGSGLKVEYDFTPILQTRNRVTLIADTADIVNNVCMEIRTWPLAASGDMTCS